MAGTARRELATSALTGQGRHALSPLAAIADRNGSQLFNCPNPEEKATFQMLLRKLAELHQIRDVPIE
jgi:hypothetical protein